MPVTTSVLQVKSAWGEIDAVRGRSLETFVDKLIEQEGDNLLRVMLFGSVARGDSRRDSDLDVFVLVKEGEWEDLRTRIVDIAIDIDLEEGECKTHLSPFINTQAEYEYGRKIGLPILSFIEEEGITLYDVR